MTLDVETPTLLSGLPWPEDDTEESVMGADWHQNAIIQAFLPLKAYADERAAKGLTPWYVSTEVTVQVPIPRRLWSPKPDLFVVAGVSPEERSSYDTRVDGPMPPFVLEVVSKSTWKNDTGTKRIWYGIAGVQEYLVFDPTREYLPVGMLGWHATDQGWMDWEPGWHPDGPDVRAVINGSEVWESSILGLTVRPEGRLVRFDHPQTGPLPLPSEMRARLAEQARTLAEREQALTEQARALDEERRARAALEAEVRHLRGEQPPTSQGG